MKIILEFYLLIISKHSSKIRENLKQEQFFFPKYSVTFFYKLPLAFTKSSRL